MCKIDGYIFAFVTTILLLCIICLIVYTYKSRPQINTIRESKVKESNENKKTTYLKIGITSIICLLLFIWLLFPTIQSNLNGIYWKGYQEELGSYKANGFSTHDAINNIQAMERADIQANAIYSGTANIAAATILARR